MATPKKETSGLSAPNATETGGTKMYVGEGTTVLPLPFDDTQIVAPGHKARKVSDLQKGSEKLHDGIFK